MAGPMARTNEQRKELKNLFGGEPRVQRIATGFTFTEGPVWDFRHSRLFFSDIPGDKVYEWNEIDGHSVFRQPSGNTNGNTIDLQGGLVSCEHSGRRVVRTNADGSIDTLSDNYQGKKLNSPNDVICAANGDLIFTDPPYGLTLPDGTVKTGDLDFNGVYRLDTDGSIELLIDDFVRPNGLMFDAQERRLFIDDTERRHIRVFDIGAGCMLENGRVFAEIRHGNLVGRPDGMKMDVEGNIYVAGNTSDGIWVFNPEGALLGLVGVGEGPANLAWGGDDWRTLFVTANTSVYRISMRVAGIPVGVAKR